jgi:hypothetical protein
MDLFSHAHQNARKAKRTWLPAIPGVIIIMHSER